MNQGRGIYLDLCGHSIRLVMGLINLQFQVRTKMAACWRNQLNACSVKPDCNYYISIMLELLIRVMLRDDMK